MVQKLPEQVELLRGELYLGLADMSLPTTRVDVKVSVPDLRRRGRRAGWRRPTENRLDARDELARIERFGHVVVGSDLEADDLVDVLVARSQHEDRDVPPLANSPADLDAVDVGKHQIEHHQRRLLGFDLSQRVAPGRDSLDRVARVLQIERDERSDRGLILDDQDDLGL